MQNTRSIYQKNPTMCLNTSNEQLETEINKINAILSSSKKKNELQNKRSDFKMGLEPEWTFFQRRHTDDHQVHEKVLNVTNHQGNANQNHKEILPHTCKMAVVKKMR